MSLCDFTHSVADSGRERQRNTPRFQFVPLQVSPTQEASSSLQGRTLPHQQVQIAPDRLAFGLALGRARFTVVFLRTRLLLLGGSVQDFD